MHRASRSAALLCALGVSLAAPAAEVFLTRDGAPAASIVLGSSPSLSAQFAAAELQDHVRRISGATLPIVDAEQPLTGTRILVGESAATRALGLPGEAFQPQEYLIRSLPDTLVLMGSDSEPAASSGPGIPAPVEGKFGRARGFGGEKDVLAVPDCGFNDEHGTLEAWVWLPATPPEKRHGTILRLDGDRPWTYHIIQRDLGTCRISYTTYDGTLGHGLTTPDLAAGWHHVVGTYDAASRKQTLWVDGVKQGETDYVKTTCAGAVLGVGAVTVPFGNPLVGRVDEVRISNIVRDPLVDARGGPYQPDANTTCLYHFDEAGGAPVESINASAHAVLPREGESCGTLYAVYDLLERGCGVRWYAPGEVGRVCPPARTLAVSGLDRRRQPAMEMRWIAGASLYMPTAADTVPATEFSVWKLRTRIGGALKVTGHSFYGYYDRYLKDHPDWFAQGYGAGQPPQMCYTSDGFIQQAAQDADDYFAGKGAPSGAAAGAGLFGLVPMDNSSWCNCARCQALLNPAEKDNPQFNNGWASDYIYDFTNRVARAVGKKHPGQWIQQLAYSTYAYHPEKVQLEPNVSVQMCLHTRNWWCPSMEANDRKMLSDWRSREPNRPLYLWLYYCFPALNAKSGNFHYFPGFFAHSVVKQMKLYHDAGIRGLYIENSSECGATYLMDQLEYYVTFKLADDPTLDGDQLIEEFFGTYYGAAAAPMKALYGRIEDLFSSPQYYPPEIQQSKAHQHQTEELAWGSLGTPARLAEMQALLDQAMAAARTDVEKQRLALFKVGIWDYMIEGRRLYEVHRLAQARPPLALDVPAVTGAAGDPAKVDWDKLPDLGGWGGLTGDPAGRRFETRLAHDGQYLYVQLVDHTDPATLRSADPVYDGDDLELIFAPARSADQHTQFIVAPNGKTLGLTWRKSPVGEWPSGCVVVSETSAKDRWSAKIALPLAKLWPAGWQPGQKVYANFYRNGGRDLLAWQPTFASGFHDLARLPELTLK